MRVGNMDAKIHHEIGLDEIQSGAYITSFRLAAADSHAPPEVKGKKRREQTTSAVFCLSFPLFPYPNRPEIVLRANLFSTRGLLIMQQTRVICAESSKEFMWH